MSKIVVIQKVVANYRAGFFDLLSEKIEYTLISSNKNSGKIKAPKDLKLKKYAYFPVTIQLSEYFIIFPFLFFSLINLRPKIIITEGGQNTINNIAVWIYCKLFHCEYIVWDLGKNHISVEKKSLLRKVYDDLYNFILNAAQQVYTYHNVGKAYFIAQGFKRNIIPLKNTIDTRKIPKFFGNYDDEKQILLNKKFEKYAYRILFVGALGEKKSLETLKVLMELLPDEYCLVIVGSGNEQYVNQLKRLLDSDCIYFEGYKDMNQLQYYYNCMDFFILPGLGGLAINQAMAFGLPVVCTAADGIEKELIINDKTGYLYNSIEEAVKYILARHKEDWTSMGKNAKNLIFSEYTIDKMVDRFVNGLKKYID